MGTQTHHLIWFLWCERNVDWRNHLGSKICLLLPWAVCPHILVLHFKLMNYNYVTRLYEEALVPNNDTTRYNALGCYDQRQYNMQ